jgi:hypothetical protein
MLIFCSPQVRQERLGMVVDDLADGNFTTDTQRTRFAVLGLAKPIEQMGPGTQESPVGGDAADGPSLPTLDHGFEVELVSGAEITFPVVVATGDVADDDLAAYADKDVSTAVPFGGFVIIDWTLAPGGRSESITFPVSGCVGVARLQTNADSIYFGTALVRQPSVQTITLSNVGAVGTQLTVECADDDISVEAVSGFFVEAQSSAVLNVTFTPSSVRALESTITFHYQVSRSPHLTDTHATAYPVCDCP